MLRKLVLLMVFVAIAAVAGASEGGEHGKTLHWGYSGEGGPAHWGSLSPEFKMCGIGQKQSPINLTGMVDINLPELKYNYEKTGLHIINNGHTIKVDYKEGSSMQVNKDRYNLLQFHFHSPSENTVEGESFPLEAHLVHANRKGELAVISVLFREGAANPAIEELWHYAPSKVNSTMDANAKLNVTELLPESRDYYTFDGSLTTPPCTEGVRWLVLKQPMTISAEQIAKFRRIFKDQDTNRPVQPLNGRVIYE